MAKNDSTQPKLVNGFEPVSVGDIESLGHITFEQSQAIGTIFRTIARLTDDREIKELCNHGALQSDLQGNDIDVIRERAARAGLAVGGAS